MKNLLTIILTFVSLNLLAQDMPKYLKGAKVTVTLKNGKKYTFKSEDYAVVPRNGMGKVKQQLATVIRKIEKKQLVKNKKNRVYGLIGRGIDGDMNVSTNGSRYSVEQDKGTVGGIGYQRKLNETLNLGIQVQSNSTTSLSLGLDF